MACCALLGALRNEYAYCSASSQSSATLRCQRISCTLINQTVPSSCLATAGGGRCPQHKSDMRLQAHFSTHDQSRLLTLGMLLPHLFYYRSVKFLLRLVSCVTSTSRKSHYWRNLGCNGRVRPRGVEWVVCQHTLLIKIREEPVKTS